MSTYLSRTFSGANTSRKTFTLSCWLKRSNLGEKAIISASTTSNFYDNITFSSTDQLDINNVASGNDVISFKTNMQFRDPFSWYHIVIAIDTTQSSSSNGIKIYVNGILQTSFASTTYAQDATFEIGRDGSTTAIGRRERNTDYYGIGYLADFYYIDGQQKAATDFGQTDSTTGIWKPKTYSGTYGNNGFKLEFKNSAALGTDTSGNSETFTVNNAGTGAQVTDTPTNNFANLTFPGLVQNSRVSLTKGNLDFDFTGDGQDSGQRIDNQCISNIGTTKGKWYAEFKCTEDYDGAFIGISNWPNKQNNQNLESWAYIYGGNGDLYYKEKTGAGTSTTSYGSAIAVNDIVSVALDMDNKNVYWANNGQWGNGSGAWNQANPTSARSISTDFINTDSYGVVVFNTASAGANETPRWLANFGNPPFTIASSNADANGFGSFEYAPPSGYYALCTENLNTYG
jgi:hypothetical protein